MITVRYHSAHDNVTGYDEATFCGEDSNRHGSAEDNLAGEDKDYHTLQGRRQLRGNESGKPYVGKGEVDRAIILQTSRKQRERDGNHEYSGRMHC